MLTAHSIFARQWWAVVLRHAGKQRPIKKELEGLAEAIADAFNGSVHRSARATTRGVFISSLSNGAETTSGESLRAMLLLQTNRIYFPLAEDSLEVGLLANNKNQEERRDFPRRIVSGTRTLYQYPLLVAISHQRPIGPVYIIACPYYLLMRDMIRELQRGRRFSDCVSVDVARVFARLKKVKVKNGAVSMSSGRMVITGIEFLRSAVFFGDNVIASPLYTDLTKRPNVTVDPKDCRLHRSYEEPVGGNRRIHVCWFDPNGNFRFTPGRDADATVRKFFELLGVLAELDMINDAGTSSPLTRAGSRLSA